MPRAGDPTDRLSKALQSVCAGCRRTFTPMRSNQRHCRPSCRGLALARRRTANREDRDHEVCRLFE
jgi:hypothetical protein